MQQISGTVKNVVYQNKDNGYTVLRTTKQRTLCGTLYDTSVNLAEAEFVAKGEWQKHKKFGYQFHFKEFTINESELYSIFSLAL